MKTSQVYGAAFLAAASNVYGQSTTPASYNNSGAPTVDLGYVKYQGYSNATAGINYFRGIQWVSGHHMPYDGPS